jgi:hypothetical protein
MRVEESMRAEERMLQDGAVACTELEGALKLDRGCD